MVMAGGLAQAKCDGERGSAARPKGPRGRGEERVRRSGEVKTGRGRKK